MPNIFMGRGDLLNNIVNRLLSGQTRALSVEGLPGIGKTTLAIAVAHDKRVLDHFTDGVLWAGLGRYPDVLSQLGSWANALRIDVTDKVTEQARSDVVKNAIGQGRYLLIIDDAWGIKVANWLKCGGPNCCHLLTTRQQEIAYKFAGKTQMTTVTELSPEVAFDLFQQLAYEAVVTDSDAAKRLLKLVGYLPLAIELLGGILAKSKFFKQRITALAKLSQPIERLKLTTKRLGSHTKEKKLTLEEIIKLSLSELSPETLQAFYALGAFAPKPAIFGLEAALYVAETNEDNLAVLIDSNLLTQQANDRLSLHQSIADVAQIGLDSQAQVRHRDYYLQEVNKDPKDWQYIEIIYPQLQYAWAKIPKDETILDFIRAVRSYQQRRGLFNDLRTWHLAGLDVAQVKDKAELLTHIGAGYYRHDYYRQAIDYYQQALPIHEDLGNQAGLAENLNAIAVTYRTIGKYQEALSYLERALSIQQKSGDHADLAGTFVNIGMTYSRMGNSQEAIAYLKRALPLYKELGRRGGFAVALNEIGIVYRNSGDYEQALDYFQQALPIREEEGVKPGIARTLNSIGEIYYAMGNNQFALDYYRRALPILEEIGNHNGESVTRYNIAKVYQAQDNLKEAVEQLQLSVSLAELMEIPYLERYKAELAQLEANLAGRLDNE
jgi:tetratricopeptide (TPR) repeat protein